MSSPQLGDRFPEGHRVAARYTVVSIIGEGASAIVYCATRDEDGQRVALKVIHRHLCDNEQVFKRYHREAAILKRIQEPHVVGMLEFFEDDGLLVIALDYIEGSSLEELLKQRGAPLEIEPALEIALQICSALESAHSAGVVHRDLKPANVLIERAPTLDVRLDVGTPAGASAPFTPGSGSTGQVRVVDFGLAKVVHTTQVTRSGQVTTGLTAQDMIFGTPEYMAPEQVRGEEVDSRCDIYALGCMLYEMVVGEVPFPKRTVIASMTAHLVEEPLRPRAAKSDIDISAHFEAVILRALAKSADERYQTAREFADALLACRERGVIAYAGEGTADSLSQTDLALGRTGAEHAATVPDAPPLVGSISRARALGLARTLPAEVANLDLVQASKLAVLAKAYPANEHRRASAQDRLARERLVWIVVAVVFSAIGIAIGTMFGTR